MGTFIVYGSEPWMIRKQKERFKSLSQSEYDYAEFTQIDNCISFLETFNFLADRTYAYLYIGSVREINDALGKFITSIRNNANRMLFIEVEKVGKGDMEILSGFSGTAVIKKYDKLKEPDYLKAVDEICRRQGIEFTSEDAKKAFVERLDYLCNEAVNLITVENYAGQLKYLSPVLEEVDVINNMPDFREGRKFMLSSLIASNDVAGALNEAGRLKRSAGFSAIALMSLLHREYRIAYLQASGFSLEQQKVYRSNIAGKFSRNQLLKAMTVISESLRDVKTGIYDQQTAFDLCLAELLNIRGGKRDE